MKGVSFVRKLLWIIQVFYFFADINWSEGDSDKFSFMGDSSMLSAGHSSSLLCLCIMTSEHKMLKKIRMNSLYIIKTCVNLPQRSYELFVLLAILYALLYDS